MNLILRILLCFLICFSKVNSNLAQICPGVQLNGQDDVNQFGADGCATVSGGLHILGNVTDLSPLSSIRRITGYLWITSTSLESLDGLNNLDSVGSYIRIYYNSHLKDIDALANLRKVDAYIDVQANDSLVSTAGFLHLESAQYIRIKGNQSLQTVGSFDSLRRLNSLLDIDNNPSLNGVNGFNSLEQVNDIRITGIGGIGTISGFNKIDTLRTLAIGGSNAIDLMPSFSALRYLRDDLGISGIREIGNIHMFDSINHVRYLSIRNNNLLQELPTFYALDTIENLNIQSNHTITSITALSNLIPTQQIYISDNSSLISINAFSQSNATLQSVIINFNSSLEEIDAFNTTATIYEIFISENNELQSIAGFDQLISCTSINIENCSSLEIISGFSKLKKVGEGLHLRHLGLSELSGFDQLDTIGSGNGSPNIKGLYIHEIPNLISLRAFSSLRYLYNLNIYGLSRLESIDGLQQLNHIEAFLTIYYCDSMESLFSNTHLRILEGHITIRFNPSLMDLSSLDSINIDLLLSATISDNLSFAGCNTFWICQSLNSGVGLIFENNGEGCNSLFNVTQTCTHMFPFIHVAVFYDANQDGQKNSSESLLPNAQVRIQPSDIQIFSSLYPITYFTEIGTYMLTTSMNNSEVWTLTTSDSIEIILSEAQPGDTAYFGYYPTILIESMTHTVNSDFNLCNSWITLRINANNIGTMNSTGILWFQSDPNISELVLIDTPDIQIGELLGFAFNAQVPGQNVAFQLQYKVPGPDLFPIGGRLSFESYIEYESTMDTSFHYRYTPVVLCAYDPNDKASHPSRAENITLTTENLHYTIRFQNTGNYRAANVMILDTLDSNLDLNTITVLSSSHSNHLRTFLKDNVLTFFFENIYLPDSLSNEPASHGYLEFTLQPVKPTKEYTLIQNSAAIFFDLNPPVITNTTKNLYVSNFISSTQKPDISEIFIYPNPTDGILNIETGDNGYITIELFTLDGRRLMSGAITDHTTQLDISDLNSGLYIIGITNSKNQQFFKIFLTQDN